MFSGRLFHLSSSTTPVGRYVPHISNKIPRGDLSLGHMSISNQSVTWEMGIPRLLLGAIRPEPGVGV